MTGPAVSAVKADVVVTGWFAVLVTGFACSVLAITFFPALSGFYGYKLALAAVGIAVLLSDRNTSGVRLSKMHLLLTWCSVGCLILSTFFDLDEPEHWVLLLPAFLAVMGLLLRLWRVDDATARSWVPLVVICLGAITLAAIVGRSASEQETLQPGDVVSVQDALYSLGYAVPQSGQVDIYTVAAVKDYLHDRRIDNWNGIVQRRLADKILSDATESTEQPPPTTANLALAFYTGGDAWYARQNYDLAVRDYDQAIRLKPDNADAFHNRGIVYQAKGDYDRAINDYDQAIRLKPDDANAYNSRCWARAIANKALEAALSDCNNSLRLRPDDADILSSHGFVYFRMGRYDSAITDFDKALSHDPKSVDSLYVRGLAKRMRHDTGGGDADIAAAKGIDPKVAERYATFGVKP